MRAYVGVTDTDWFELLRSQPALDEVNFWQPGGSRVFSALRPGELFLFKLHAPDNYIVGGGFFAHASLLPVSLAWSCFGVANGARDLDEMRARVSKYRRGPVSERDDYTIGCILIEQPFFLSRSAWISVPSDWRPQIVQGKTYDLSIEPGLSLWHALEGHLSPSVPGGSDVVIELPSDRYGSEVLVRPRLGQGSFRVLVTDAYARSCAVTGERVLPVLEAAHIRPYAMGGEHRVGNGILLRSDLHTLFDRGYVTVTPSLRLEVSSRIRADFRNGRAYYALHGQDVRAPEQPSDRPEDDALRWHNEQVFLA